MRSTIVWNSVCGGGMTERQRRALLKQHPEVVSWSEFFAAQRKHRSVS